VFYDKESDTHCLPLDGTLGKAFVISLSQVVHDYDDHYKLDFRFDLKPESNNGDDPEKFYHLQIDISAQALKSKDCDITLIETVENIDEIPECLQDNPSVKRLLDEKHLSALHISYDRLFPIKHLQEVIVQPSVYPFLRALRNLAFDKAGRLEFFFRSSRIQDILAFRHRVLHVVDLKPLEEYYRRKGHCRTTWRSAKSWPEVPSFEYDVQDFFHSFDYYYITYAYGLIRDEEYAISQMTSIEDHPRQLYVLRIPDPSPNNKKDSLKPSKDVYLGFLQLSEKEISMSCFDRNEFFKVQFAEQGPGHEGKGPDEEQDAGEDPNEDKEPNTKHVLWNAYVIPPLTGLRAPGNLTVLLRRPAKDIDRVIEINEEVIEGMSSNEVYLQSLSSDLSARPKDLKRILMGQEPKHDYPFDFLDDLTDEESALFGKIYDSLRPGQQDALDRIMARNMIALIQGPPGTGKSFFIAQLVIILAKRNVRILITCPSNPATDTLAETIDRLAPELKIIRFHSLNFETSQLSRKAKQASGKGDNPDVAATEVEDEPTLPDEEVIALHKARLVAVRASIRLAQQRSPKLYGRNVEELSLMARCMERVDALTNEDILTGAAAAEVITYYEALVEDPDKDYGEEGYVKDFFNALREL
ncbi:MAG: hypothetical protein Q9222_005359, partial [Ikaeria aurantiellina]